MPRESSGAGFIYAQETFTVSLPPGTSQVSSILSLPRGFLHTIMSVKTIVKVAATGAGATRTLNVRKGNATGTVVATATWALADGATVGTVKDIPVTVAAADFLDADTLTIEWATAGAVAFTAGEVTFVLTTRKRTQQRN
jgi:hypothetical protein